MSDSPHAPEIPAEFHSIRDLLRESFSDCPHELPPPGAARHLVFLELIDRALSQVNAVEFDRAAVPWLE